MKLLTKEIINQFEKQGKVDELPSEKAKVICKFFNPTGNGTWYAIEYDSTQRMFFGFVDLGIKDCEEFGYFSLDELESLKVPPFGLGIERDMHFKPIKVSELKKQYNLNY
jgi:hypothetical protein